MPYLGVCRKCNHHTVASEKWIVEEYLDLHGMEEHGTARNVIVYINDKLFQMFQRNKSNPKFWEAIRKYRIMVNPH